MEVGDRRLSVAPRLDKQPPRDTRALISSDSGRCQTIARLPIMSLDPPPLVLEDIVHGMSPSPGPQNAILGPDVRSPTPEQLDEEQASAMRKRVLEISSTAGMSPAAEFTGRETELVRMVRDFRPSSRCEFVMQGIRSEAAALHF